MTKETEQIVGKISKQNRTKLEKIKAELGGISDMALVKFAIKNFIAEFNKETFFKPLQNIDEIQGKKQNLLYLGKNESQKGFFKIGITTNLKQRRRSIQTGNPMRDFKIIKSWETIQNKQIEKHIKKKYNYQNEWIKGDEGQIIKDIESMLNK